jgi:dienelactone hydrolase
MIRRSLAALVVSIPLWWAALPAQDFTAQAKALAADLFARQFDKVTSQFTDKMTAAIPPAKLATMLDDLFSQTGSFRGIEGTRAEIQQGYHVVFVTCRFEKASLDLRLVFDAAGKLAGMFFAPSAPKVEWSAPGYAKPDAFQERQVAIGSGKWQLPGTLTLPRGSGPFPAVVLVHGSGPHDGDETVGPNKPFKDLAWGLAGRGIAVLRYTKRTLRMAELKESPAASFTVKEETVDDARAAVSLLAGTGEIRRGKIYVLGHSLGGMLAPRIADGDSNVAGVILMAGSCQPLEQSVIEQLKYLATLPGADAAAAAKQIEAAERAAMEIRSLKPGSASTIEFLGSRIPASYFLDLRSYHPAETAAGLKIPILVLQGGRDYQVTLKDFEAWKSALDGRDTATFKLYAGLTHLFMPSAAPGTAPGTPQDYASPGHVVEEVIADLAAWILKP